MEKQKHGELTKVKGTYSHALKNHQGELTTYGNNPKANLVEYKNFVVEIVKNESKETPKQRAFIQKILSQKSNTQLTYLVWDAMLAADNLNVIK